MALATGSLLVFVRILTSVLTAPLFSQGRVPVIFRVGLALLLSTVTVPTLMYSESWASLEQTDLFSAIMGEALIGASIGLCVSILISAAQVAGQIIGQLAGINLTDPIGGENAQVGGVTAGFFNMLSLAVFAMMGGPELMVSAVLETFQQVPLGFVISQQELLDLMATLLGQSLSLAVRAVGPAIASLLIATLTLGFISRTIPQLNMLQFGLNSNLIVFWLAIFLTLGGCVWLFVDDIQTTVDFIQDKLAEQTASRNV